MYHLQDVRQFRALIYFLQIFRHRMGRECGLVIARVHRGGGVLIFTTGIEYIYGFENDRNRVFLICSRMSSLGEMSLWTVLHMNYESLIR